MLLPRLALPTMHATAGIPTDADALADLKSLGRGPDGGDAPDDFVAKHGWIAGIAPIVVSY